MSLAETPLFRQKHLEIQQWRMWGTVDIIAKSWRHSGQVWNLSLRVPNGVIHTRHGGPLHYLPSGELT